MVYILPWLYITNGENDRDELSFDRDVSSRRANQTILFCSVTVERFASHLRFSHSSRGNAPRGVPLFCYCICVYKDTTLWLFV